MDTPQSAIMERGSYNNTMIDKVLYSVEVSGDTYDHAKFVQMVKSFDEAQITEEKVAE